MIPTSNSVQRLGISATAATYGLGIGLDSGADVSLDSVRLSANHHIGFFVDGSNTAAAIARLLIDGTLPQKSDNASGVGLLMRKGAQVTLEDARLSGNCHIGLNAEGAATQLHANRLVIGGTLPQQSDKKYGFGVSLTAGAAVVVQDARISANHGCGLALDWTGTTLAARRILVDGTLPEQSSKEYGRGLALQYGATVELLASRVDGKATGEDTALADGVELQSSPDAALGQCLILANERTGVLIESSSGVQLKRSLISGAKGLYGLVFQNTLDAIDQFNLVFGASVKDRAQDAGLSLPAPPQPVKTL